ncbi:hypothetical protein GT037_010012, partial [Alternaria burnsii]
YMIWYAAMPLVVVRWYTALGSDCDGRVRAYMLDTRASEEGSRRDASGTWILSTRNCLMNRRTDSYAVNSGEHGF